MTQPRFTLFSYWRTSAVYRVRVALNLKGIAAEERNVDLDAGEQRSAEFLQINPLGAIPALIDQGLVPPRAPLTQSLAILEYLEEVQPSPPILPGDAYGRARVRALASMMAADTHPLIVARVRDHLKSEGGFDDERVRAWQVHWFTTGLKALERRLASEPETGRFCHGDTPTMADICLASVVTAARVIKIRIEDVPVVDRVMAACEALEAFAKADPMRQAGAPAPA